MMTFFPVPYDDEILYSILARYHIRSGNTSIKATLQDIYGKTSVTAVVDLPSHLQRLIYNMPINTQYTADDLVDKHTLYPFYSAFLPPQQAEKIREYMKNDKGGGIYNKIGLMASSITLNQYFKFCPQCVKEDMEKYGELYWHRVHQIPGVYVCPKHKISLHDSQVPVRGFNKHEYKTAAPNVCKITDDKINYPDEILVKMITLAEDVVFLLNHQFPNKPLEWFREQYLNRLKELGYANINGRIRQKDLLASFVDYYGNDFLKMVQSDIDINNDYNWLTGMLRRKNKTSHPLRHLLLMQFLGIPVTDMFNTRLEYKPFGDGPWPCLNPAAAHYLEPVISSIEIKYCADNKRPIGIFKCDCGFIYARTGPDREESDRCRITKIKAFGPVWEAKLRELAQGKLSLREAARRLHVDSATVKKHALRLGLNAFWGKSEKPDENPNIVDCSCSGDNKREIYRQEWLKLRDKYPDKCKTELRRLSPGLYTWLYRNDREWLGKNSPEFRLTKPTNSRIDWDKRDKELLEKVKKTVSEMMVSEGKPKRITVSSVGQRLGARSFLEKSLSKLHRTREYLEAEIESIRDFQIRRIKWAIQELKNENRKLQLWRIFKKAGIRKEYQADLRNEVFKLMKLDTEV